MYYSIDIKCNQDYTEQVSNSHLANLWLNFVEDCHKCNKSQLFVPIFFLLWVNESL